MEKISIQYRTNITKLYPAVHVRQLTLVQSKTTRLRRGTFSFYAVDCMNRVTAAVCVSVVLRSSGRTAFCSPPPDTDTVGQRLGAAETGASVPELGEQSELATSHRQPAGQTAKNPPDNYYLKIAY